VSELYKLLIKRYETSGFVQMVQVNNGIFLQISTTIWKDTKLLIIYLVQTLNQKNIILDCMIEKVLIVEVSLAMLKTSSFLKI